MKKNKISKKALMTRIMAGILCALMVFSVLVAIIPFLGDHSDHDHASVEHSMVDVA